MTIDFEKDQQDAMKKTEGIQSLADQVQRLEAMHDNLKYKKMQLKKRKNKDNIYQVRLYQP